MHRPLASLPTLALLLAAATLLALGATLGADARASADTLDRREAFAASVQRGERSIPAANVAGALQAELTVQREAAKRDAQLALLAFCAGALAVAGAGMHFLAQRERGAAHVSAAAA